MSHSEIAYMTDEVNPRICDEQDVLTGELRYGLRIPRNGF